MVISHKHRYVFVEIPHTGSHAISKELCEFYDGQIIHRKHANVTQFLSSATAEERKYFIFATVRNPLDTAVTDYLKLRHNHKGQYTNPAQRIENGGQVTKRHREEFDFIQSSGADLATFISKYRSGLYNNWFLVGYRRFDYVLRYERLAEEYENVISQLGLELVRPLPRVNPTKGKKNFVEFYDADMYELVARRYGPFMRRWGYNFPDNWPDVRIPWSSLIKFVVKDGAINLAARKVKLDPNSRLVSRLKGVVDAVF